MQMNKIIALTPFALSLVFMMSVAVADSPWSNEIEMGFLLNRGNNYNTHFDSRYTNQYQDTLWLNKVSVATILDVGKDSTTREKYRSAEKYSFLDNLKFKFTEKDYIYTEVNGVKDQFSAYDYEVAESIGYGRKLANSDKFKWYLEGGPGGRHSRATRFDNSKIHHDELVAHVSTHLNYGLSSTAELSQDVSYDYGENVQKTKSTSSVKAKVWGKVSLKLSYVLEYNALLPDTKTKQQHTDTTTTLTAAYMF